MIKKTLSCLILLILLVSIPSSALAQDYYFQLEQNVVHVYWNEDGTMSLDYTMVFHNDPSGHSIDFVDLGLPNYNFNENTITAEIDGRPVDYISGSEFQGTGSGVAIALGINSIPPGQTGTLHVYVPNISNVLFVDDNDDTYVSAVFAPAYFISSVVYGDTNIEVTFHLPPGVQPEEPRWHSAPGGFSQEPATGFDSSDRITYFWRNPNANPDSEYEFGASFPGVYVPSNAVAVATIYDRTGINPDAFIGFLCFGGFFGIIVLVTLLGVVNERRRKMKYLPPKIRIEGHGIKRGLTAVEAAVLMEHPPDKVLTMILFSVIKKGGARVNSQDPLKIEPIEPQPDNLRNYEEKFIEAFKENNARERRRDLQTLMITLIRSVSSKMKGFSHKETVAYYQKIMEKAWQQVEAADTPEVKSQKFDDHMGWTMLDRDFDRRTRDVFRTGPVFVPIWWGRYDPGWSRSASRTSTAPSMGGGRVSGSPSLPNLPGGAFAASVVSGMQNFAGGVVGNISDFTSGVTQKTNPIPKSSSKGSYRSGGGGSSCACACACAGCACACAGGGR